MLPFESVGCEAPRTKGDGVDNCAEAGAGTLSKPFGVSDCGVK